jgi:multicomponent Na+:H+ antiporter subunit D
VFIHAVGSRNLEDLAGLGRKMPVATFSLAIASLSLVGVPPFNVFFSKLLLFNAFLDKNPVLALVLVVSSVTALVAYVRVFYEVWLGKPRGDVEAGESWGLSGVCLVLALACVVIGLVAPYVVSHYVDPAAVQAVDYKVYIQKALEYAAKLKMDL